MVTTATKRDICPYCGGTYPATRRDSYNVHSGSDRHREAIARSVGRGATYCHCGSFVPDSSGDAGCGNCGADYGPDDRP